MFSLVHVHTHDGKALKQHQTAKHSNSTQAKDGLTHFNISSPRPAATTAACSWQPAFALVADHCAACLSVLLPFSNQTIQWVANYVVADVPCEQLNHILFEGNSNDEISSQVE